MNKYNVNSVLYCIVLVCNVCFSLLLVDSLLRRASGGHINSILEYKKCLFDP